MPASMCIILFLGAFLFLHSRPVLSRRYLASGVLLLLASTIAPITDTMTKALENNYEAFTYAPKPIDYIVILGCSHSTDYALPATSELDICSLQRLVEGVRILKLYPNAQLIMSGGAGSDPTSNAEKSKQAAMLLGIPEYKILTENFPLDTEEEAELIAPRVIGKQTVIITNAVHMTRAMNYFEQQGVSAIAAPTGFWVKGEVKNKNWRYYFPNAEKLAQTTATWHEVLGLSVQWVKSLL